MSLLLDALKKAARQKAEKENALNIQPGVSDEATIIEQTQIESDATVAFDEERAQFADDQTEQQELTITVLEEDSTLFSSQNQDTLHIPIISASEEAAITEYQELTTTVFEEDITVVADKSEKTLNIPLGPSDETIVFDDDQTEPAEDKTEPQGLTASASEQQAVLSEDETAKQLLHEYSLNQTASTPGVDAGSAPLDAAQSRPDDTQQLRAPNHQPSAQQLSIGKGTHDTVIVEAIGSVNFEADSMETPADGVDCGAEPDAIPAALSLENNTDSKKAEDASLSLMETDDNTPLAMSDDNATESDVMATGSKLQILADASRSTENLELDGITRNEAPDNQTRPSALGDVANQAPVSRHTSTSAHSSAPDNYDRTLIKINQGSGSKLNAGVDFVMTPDQAKKVFISKSSLQRRNNYKIYSGVAAAILLVIFMIGLFEYEEESETIDNSLSALKRDPTPNIVSNSSKKAATELFDIKNSAAVGGKEPVLVGNAENIAAETDNTIVDDIKVNPTTKAGERASSAGKQKADIAAADSDENKAATVKPEANKTPVTQVAANSANADVDAPPQPFQLTSKNTVMERDKLLEQAYAAYQQGDNATALAKYNQVLAEDGDNRNALLARAAINAQNNNIAASIRDYQKLLLANPKDSLAMSSLISVANISPQKSESQLKHMIRDEPDSPYLNFALANVYGAQNRWREAQSHYFIALENNPTDPNYAYNLAVSLEHIAQPKAAIIYYQRALENLNHGPATFNKAVVDQRLEILRKL